MERFIDELARAARAEPLEFRRRLMCRHPKHLAVQKVHRMALDCGHAV